MFIFCCQFHLPNPQFQTPKPSRETQPRGGQSIRKDSRRLFDNQRRKPPLEVSLKHSSYMSLLQCFSRERFLEGGLQLHAHMTKTGFGSSDPYLQTSLLNMYSRCESLDSALRLFDTGNLRSNLVSWNIIITMYRQFGFTEEAFSMYLELLATGLAPDQYTLSTLIGIVQERGELSLGSQIHSVCVKFGYGQEEFVTNSLIKMYAAFGRMDASFRVFEEIRVSASAVAWNTMIARFVQNEFCEDGLMLYQVMQKIGILPTALTLSSVLKACEQIGEGKQVHAQVILHGFLPNVIIETVLVEFYSRCGEVGDGKRVFEQMEDRNVYTWNSMIRGYSQLGHREEALELFRAMMREGIAPDKFTFPALLSGVTQDDDEEEEEDYNFLQEFRSVHSCIIKMGLERDRFIGTSLVTMYSRNRSLDEARLVFDDTDSKDIGVWASMICACVKSKEGEEAIQLFTEMLQSDIEPGPSTFSSLFVACGDLISLELGKQIHGYSLKQETFLDSAAQNSLITMYSSCGFLSEAWRIFDSISDRNVVSFNSMISALAQHSLAIEAARLFEQMELSGIKPEAITVLNLLSAFNHAGLTEEGLQLFNSMEHIHGIKPRYRHFACVVDLLARAGEIEQAVRLIGAMPYRPDTSLWRIVLGACGKHRNLEIGRRVAEQLVELEPHEATNYVLIANVYARLGRWVEATKIRSLMVEMGLKKEEGVSWIEIKRRVYKFGVRDQSHPQCEQIYDKLGELMKKIKAKGYEPDVSFTVHEMEDERREESLWYHGEKLAFAFGVISSADKEVKPIRIIKTLRVCGDCHCAFKYFSVVTGREILVRDNYRFHHFKGGECSCGDYW